MKTRVEVEATVAGIWRELLNVPAVQLDDNFLDLGGNSLRAGEMALRIRSELGVDVPLDVILSEESLASLSNEICRAVEGVEQV
jgi:acyl carrier protein